MADFWVADVDVARVALGRDSGEGEETPTVVGVGDERIGGDGGKIGNNKEIGAAEDRRRGGRAGGLRRGIRRGGR